MNTSTRRLHTSGFARLAHRGGGGGSSEEVEGSGMTSALLGWEAGVGAGRQGHWRQAGRYSRVAVASASGGPAQSRDLEGNALPATSATSCLLLLEVMSGFDINVQQQTHLEGIPFDSHGHQR